MDVREKLVELLSEIIDGGFKWHNYLYESGEQLNNDEIASFLVTNGVTVQEWISVDDRLPENGGYVVCIAKRNPFSRFMPMVARIEKNGWVNPITEQYISEVTNWMPLPDLPKGE